jgi:hypothetical protein
MKQRLEMRYPKAKLQLLLMRKYQDRMGDGKNYQKDE